MLEEGLRDATFQVPMFQPWHYGWLSFLHSEGKTAAHAAGTGFVSDVGMRLTLEPNGHIAHTRPHSYIVELPDGASAIVDAVNGRWHLSIRHDGKVTDRGMFVTTGDVLDLLEVEFVRSPISPRK